MSEYSVERDLLRKHRKEVEKYQDLWQEQVTSRFQSSQIQVDAESFTYAGKEFSRAYHAILQDYQTHIAGISEAFAKAAAGLTVTINTYGKAESEVTAGVKKVESPKRGTSLKDLLTGGIE
jgi:uncharacterized protein YukE